MKEDPTHVVTMSFVRMMCVRMVMEVWHVRGRVMRIKVLIMPEFVIWCYGRIEMIGLEMKKRSVG